MFWTIVGAILTTFVILIAVFVLLLIIARFFVQICVGTCAIVLGGIVAMAIGTPAGILWGILTGLIVIALVFVPIAHKV